VPFNTNEMPAPAAFLDAPPPAWSDRTFDYNVDPARGIGTVRDDRGTARLVARRERTSRGLTLRVESADAGVATPFLILPKPGTSGLGVAFEVIESESGARLGSVERGGAATAVRLEWTLKDPLGSAVGLLGEVSFGTGVLRRLLRVSPRSMQEHVFVAAGASGNVNEVGVATGRAFRVRLPACPASTLDRKVLIAAVLLHGIF